MKTRKLQNTKTTKRSGLFLLSAIVALFTIAAFLIPLTIVRAADPALTTLSPNSAALNWNGTAVGGGALN
nr:hypothetical protein [Acidobacteriota bacterium]